MVPLCHTLAPPPNGSSVDVFVVSIHVFIHLFTWTAWQQHNHRCPAHPYQEARTLTHIHMRALPAHVHHQA